MTSAERHQVFFFTLSCFSRAFWATSAEGDQAALSTLPACTLAHHVLRQLISHSFFFLLITFLAYATILRVVPERGVWRLIQGLVSEQGRTRWSHIVLQVCWNVSGRGAAEDLQPFLQNLFPALQRLQHGVTQRRAYRQICSNEKHA